jgi:hypothetical protein
MTEDIAQELRTYFDPNATDVTRQLLNRSHGSGLPVQKWASVEEWWADKLKPSRRRRLQMTPYQRQCLAIVLRGLRPEKSEPQE